MDKKDEDIILYMAINTTKYKKVNDGEWIEQKSGNEVFDPEIEKKKASDLLTVLKIMEMKGEKK